MFYGFSFDRYDKPVERNRFDYPYSYDPFVVHRNGDNSEINQTMYSDRMMQWDMNKFNAAVKKVFGDTRQMFGGARFSQCQDLVRAYCEDDNIELILVEQGCNVSTGYPYTIFSFKQ